MPVMNRDLRDLTPLKRTAHASDGGDSKRMRMNHRVISLYFERCFNEVMMDELVSDSFVLEDGDTTGMLIAKLRTAKLSVKLDKRLFEKRDESICLVKHHDKVLELDQILDDIPNSGKLFLSFEIRVKFVSLVDNSSIMGNVDTEIDVGSLRKLASMYTQIPLADIVLRFEDDREMDDDAKYMSEYKDFLLDPVSVAVYYSRGGGSVMVRSKQVARKSVGGEESDGSEVDIQSLASKVG